MKKVSTLTVIFMLAMSATVYAKSFNKRNVGLIDNAGPGVVGKYNQDKDGNCKSEIGHYKCGKYCCIDGSSTNPKDNVGK